MVTDPLGNGTQSDRSSSVLSLIAKGGYPVGLVRDCTQSDGSGMLLSQITHGGYSIKWLREGNQSNRSGGIVSHSASTAGKYNTTSGRLLGNDDLGVANAEASTCICPVASTVACVDLALDRVKQSGACLCFGFPLEAKRTRTRGGWLEIDA